MGITTELPPVASLATGSVDVSPLGDGRGLRDARQRRDALLAVHRRDDPARQQGALPARSRLRARPAAGHRPPDHRHAGTRARVSGTAASAFWPDGATWPVAGKTGTANLTRTCGSAATRARSRRRCGWDRNGTPVLARLGVRRHGRRADLARLHDPRDGRACRRSASPSRRRRPRRRCPTWSGMTSDEAIAALQAAGFNATVVEVDSLRAQGDRGRPDRRRAARTADLGTRR